MVSFRFSANHGRESGSKHVSCYLKVTNTDFVPLQMSASLSLYLISIIKLVPSFPFSLQIRVYWQYYAVPVHFQDVSFQAISPTNLASSTWSPSYHFSPESRSFASGSRLIPTLLTPASWFSELSMGLPVGVMLVYWCHVQLSLAAWRLWVSVLVHSRVWLELRKLFIIPRSFLFLFSSFGGMTFS